MVRRCSAAKDTALHIFVGGGDKFSHAPVFFEAKAMTCETYIPVKPHARKRKGEKQLTLW